MFEGGLVDEVRTYYSQENKEKELLKYLLLIENSKIHSANFSVKD